MKILKIIIFDVKNPTSTQKSQGRELEPRGQDKMAGSLYDVLAVAKMIWHLVTCSSRTPMHHGPRSHFFTVALALGRMAYSPYPGSELKAKMKESASHHDASSKKIEAGCLPEVFI